MSVKVMLRLHVNPDLTEQVKAGFKEILVDTRAFEGCEGITVLQSQDDSNTLLILEQWATREDYEAYFKWRTDRGDIANIASFSTAPHEISYFDYVRV